MHTHPPTAPRTPVLLAAGLLLLTALASTAPVTADGPPGTGSNNDHTFDLSEFEKRGPTGDWTVSGGGASVTQTAAGERVAFFATDSDSHPGGPEYRDVIYTTEFDAPPPAANDNLFGLAFALTKPTGEGTLVEAYILDWKATEETWAGHTAPEGFTLYRIDGDVADTDAATQACYWAKDATACDSATGGDAALEIIASHTGPGTGWEHGESYHIGLRHEAQRIQVHVQGGAYGGGLSVIDESGDFPEIGEFALYNFRQEDVTYNHAGFRDEVAPVVDVEVQCANGNLIADPSWVGAEAACGGDPAALLRLRSSAQDHGVGLDGIECRLDQETVGTSETECLVWQTRQEPHTYPYRVLADDALGNQADEIRRYQLDTVPLELTIAFECPGVAYEDPGNAFTACDSPSTVEGLTEVVFGAPEDERNCLVSVPAADTCDLQSLLVHGAYDFDMDATDLLGNFAFANETFLVELEDPELPVPECDIGSQQPWCRSAITLDPPTALSGIKAEACELRDETDPGADFEPIACDGSFPDGLWSYRADATSHVLRTSQIGHEEDLFYRLDSRDPEGELHEPREGVSYIDGAELPCELDLVLATVAPPCVARGVVSVLFHADDPLKDGFASGLERIEIWDGVRGVSGDSGGLWHIDTINPASAQGTYSYEWDTAEAPSPSEPHVLQTRVLQIRLHDVAGNFEQLEFEIFVLP